MKIRNTEFSIHFVRNSNGDYSVDIRKFIGKLLATVLIIYIIIASAVILVEQLIEEGHDSLYDYLEANNHMFPFFLISWFNTFRYCGLLINSL